jgi:hypothetical protein
MVCLHAIPIFGMHDREPVNIGRCRLSHRQSEDTTTLFRAGNGAVRHGPIPDTQSGCFLCQVEVFFGFQPRRFS